jgi:hypothetical protein
MRAAKNSAQMRLKRLPRALPTLQLQPAFEIPDNIACLPPSQWDVGTANLPAFRIAPKGKINRILMLLS